MTSKLKSDTARANGAKSHGPVTQMGKSISARNNTRHGFLARLDGLGSVDDLGMGTGWSGDLALGAEQQHGQPRAGDPFSDCARPLVGAVRVDRDHSSSESTPACCTTTSRPA